MEDPNGIDVRLVALIAMYVLLCASAMVAYLLWTELRDTRQDLAEACNLNRRLAMEMHLEQRQPPVTMTVIPFSRCEMGEVWLEKNSN